MQLGNISSWSLQCDGCPHHSPSSSHPSLPSYDSPPTDLLGLPQPLPMQEVPVTPIRAVPVVLPLLVYMQQGQVVALGDKELLAGCVRLLSTVIGPKVGAEELSQQERHPGW